MGFLGIFILYKGTELLDGKTERVAVHSLSLLLGARLSEKPCFPLPLADRSCQTTRSSQCIHMYTVAVECAADHQPALDSRSPTKVLLVRSRQALSVRTAAEVVP